MNTKPKNDSRSFAVAFIMTLLGLFTAPIGHAADPFGNGTIKTPTTASGGTGTAADLQTDNDVNYTVASGETASIGGFGTHGGAITSVYLFVQYTVEAGYTGTGAIKVNGVDTPIVPVLRDYGRWAYVNITGGSFGVDTSAEISSLAVTFLNNHSGTGKSVLLDCAYVVVNPQTPILAQPTWSEDFNGTGQANPMIWDYEVGYQRNNELQYYVAGPSNGWMEGGNFVIEGRKEPMGGYAYTSASIVSYNKFFWQYGRTQIRAKIPCLPGMWPAIWGCGKTGEWPSNGEVDIMEYNQDRILANLARSDGTARWVAAWDTTTPNRTIPSLTAVDPNWKTQWHIWTMQWDEQNVRLYVDNVLMGTVPQTWLVNPNTNWGPKEPFKQPFYIWLNLAMGGTGGDPTATMNSGPQRYLIDYWKIWEGATDNVAPTDIALSGSGVEDSQAIGTVVGNLSATDADPAEVHRYTLVTGDGSTHNAQFTIPEFVSDNTTLGVIKTKAVLNYADGPTRSIRVRVTDIEGLTFEKILTINVMPLMGFTLGAISGNTTEAGGTATFTVKLKSQPTANVTIGLSSSDTTEGTVSPSTLTFTSATWNTNQTVTVTGVDDAIIDGNIAYSIVTAAASSTDTNYNGLNPVDVSVTNSDNDNPAPVSSAGTDQSVSVSSASLWTPTQITTKAAWFDASDTNTLWNATTDGSLVAPGGAVARWEDKSGNSRHATQSTSGSRPIYQSNALNGLPVLDFDGLDDMFAMGGTAVSVQNVFAVFNYEGGASISGWPWVFGSKGTPDIPVFFGWDASTNVGSELPQKGAANCTLYVNGNGNGAVGTIAPFNTYDIVHASGASASPSRSNWWIGDGDGKWNGRIAELVVLSSTISADDRQRMEGYLANKWGTTANLAANHLYKTLAPKVPVSINLDGTATDSNGDTLITTWTKFSGPGIVTFGDANAVDTTAAFDIPGTYVLRLTVSDGTSQTYDECVITVSGPNVISYAGNNSTGGAVPVDGSSPYASGATVTVLGNTGTLVRAGHTFTNWNTAANGTGTPYAPGATFTITDHTTLYAQWIPNTYTITFDSVGGSAVAPITQAFGTAVTAPANPTRAGYTFTGWSPTVPATMPASNTNCTAQWAVVPAPTITTVSPISGPVAGGTTVTITGTNLTGTSAVTFGGTAVTSVTVVSSTSVTCVTPAKAAGVVDVVLTTPGGSVTKTGAFTYVVTYPVTYNGNGNSGGSAPASQNKVHDADLTLQPNSGNLVKTGFVFVGWNTATDGSGTNFTAGSIYTTNAPITLYAKWASDGGGTWMRTAAGTFNWGDTANWTDGIVATGADKTASFTPDITADQIVNLEVARTVGNILFTDSTNSSNNLTISGANILTLDRTSVTPVVDVTQSDRTLTISSAITGADGLEKTGPGTLVLSGAATYSGATTVNNGTLILNQTTGFASTPTTVASTGVLTLTSTNTAVDNWRLNTLLNGAGVINKTGAGWVQTKDNVSTFSGTVNIQAGTFGASFLSSNWTGITADFNISPGALLDARGQAITVGSLNGAGNVGTTWNTASTVTVGAGNKSGSLSGVISGNATSATNLTDNPNAGVLSLIKTGTGTQILSGNNTYTGTTTISGGTLQFAKANSLLAANWTKTKVTVNSGGTIAFNVGGTNEFTTGNVTTLLAGLGGTVSSNGLRAGSTIAFDTTNASGGTFTIADTIANTSGTGGGAVGLRKPGTGTLVLTGPNSYTGTTTVSGGTLLINGNQSTATGAVSVAPNATLGGTGTIGGSTTIEAGGKLEFNLSTPAASHDKLELAATRSLTFSGASVLTITSTSGAAPGSYVLLTAPGGITGSVPATVNLPSGWTTVSKVGNDLVLTVQTPYENWASASGLTGANALQSANPDGDTLNNLQEFAFGTNPTVSTSGPITYDLGGDVTTAGPPKAVNLLEGGGVDYRAIFGRRKNHQALGLTYTVEFSAGLDVWVPSTTIPTVLTGANSAVEIEAVSVPYPLFIPIVSDHKKPTFFRVGVTAN